MPNRMIRDSARTSPTLAKLSHGAERTFWRLTTVADDFGRFNTDPKVVRAQCFPLQLEEVKSRHVAAWLDEMRAAGLIACYRAGERHVGYFITWDKHQRTRAKESKFPDPPSSAVICCQASANAAVVGVVTTGVVTTGGVDTGGGSQGGTPAAPASLLPSSNGDHSGSRRPDPGAPWPSPLALAALWNELAPRECPRVAEVGDGRARAASRALKAKPERTYWTTVLSEVGRSSLLRGLQKNAGHEEWRATFDWMLGQKAGTANYVKITEGVYRNRGIEEDDE